MFQKNVRTPGVSLFCIAAICGCALSPLQRPNSNPAPGRARRGGGSPPPARSRVACHDPCDLLSHDHEVYPTATAARARGCVLPSLLRRPPNV